MLLDAIVVLKLKFDLVAEAALWQLIDVDNCGDCLGSPHTPAELDTSSQQDT